jgi:hypothetical protein
MKTTRLLAALAVAFALTWGATGIAVADTHAHDHHDAAAPEITLNNGAKWQGDQNMITGMTAIRGAMAANLGAIHSGNLSADVAARIAADVQKQLDFMIGNCVLEPEVDKQFHVVLEQVMDGAAALKAGEVKAGAVKIVQALNTYGQHFEHPGWQKLD